MSFEFSQFAKSVRSGSAISAQDTLALRQWAWADGVMSESDAAALFELNTLTQARDTEWIAFFTEALCDYALNGKEPKGYISEADAAWVIAQIDRDGRVDTAAELELLVKLAEKAVDTTATLKFYTLGVIEKTIISGEGASREVGEAAPCTVTAAEANLLRRMIFAPGSDGPARVSRDEADMLFRIKDACIDGDNAPEWQRLFVQGVANHLMAFSSYTPLTRERAAELESFMRNASPSIGGFFARMAQFDVKTGWDAIVGNDELLLDHDAEVAAAEEVTGSEKGWLDSKMAESAGLDPMEQALLDFLSGDNA
jgi:hypothetical protein